MKILITFVATLLLVCALALGYVYSGSYNVAATVEHSGLVERLVDELKDRSIAKRAPRAGVAPTDSASLARGFHEYDEMCVACHGAPGVEPEAMGVGLYPEPPDLAEEADEFTDAELFWIVKNGIKLTGMPAFGPTHSDSTLWAIVGAMRQVRGMTPEEYKARVAASTQAAGTTGHTHPPGTPPHTH
jgi:mono/diheme cytochrome c family protein